MYTVYTNIWWLSDNSELSDYSRKHSACLYTVYTVIADRVQNILTIYLNKNLHYIAKNQIFRFDVLTILPKRGYNTDIRNY